MPQVAAILFLLCAAAGAAGPVTLRAVSAVEWPGELALRADAAGQDFRLAAACRVLPGSAPAGQQEDVRVLAGLWLPWLSAGPLAPAGLLREALNPAGFSAGSDVFTQRTGLVLDLSFPGRRPAVLLAPVPRTLGVFCGFPADGGGRTGIVASLFNREGASVEGFACVSDLPAEDAGDEWLRSSAPFPGGSVLTSAGRILFSTPFLDAAAALGASSGERLPPGSFSHLHAAVRVPGLSAYLLLARADSTYVTPDGEHCADAGQISAALALRDSRGSADLRFSRSVGQLPLARGVQPEYRDETSFSLERVIASQGAFFLSGRVEGRKVLGPEESSSAAASCAARLPALRLEASVTQKEPPEISLRVSSQLVLDRGGSSAGLDCCVLKVRERDPVLSGAASFRLVRKDFSLALEARLETASLDGLRLSASWSVREVREAGSPSR